MTAKTLYDYKEHLSLDSNYLFCMHLPLVEHQKILLYYGKLSSKRVILYQKPHVSAKHPFRGLNYIWDAAWGWTLNYIWDVAWVRTLNYI